VSRVDHTSRGTQHARNSFSLRGTGLAATFFVANMLLAVVVEVYGTVRDDAGGAWVDPEL
jgi:Na+/H+-translocating membrane pyrophosphatase